MTVETIRVSADWLALREPADAAARSPELVERLRNRRPAGGRWTIHDLGCGSGAMARWLAPRLPGAQRWVLHDLDAALLELAGAQHPLAAADGAPVQAETRRSDITLLDDDDLAGADLITASALLDLLTAEELEGLIAVCGRVACPVLLAVSVVGRVELTPADPLDRLLGAAFDAHQRRTTADGRLLGPDAVAAAVAGFRRSGAEVLVAPSPWRLGRDEANLTAEWLEGWVGAACEAVPGLAADARAYTRRRRAQAGAGTLAVCVDHADLLVLP
jgi:SAM-dependent methyltransferase